MGCFNTQGFLSKLDITGNDEVFVLICAPYTKPIDWVELTEEKYAEHTYNGPCNRPISFPIFGEYDDYGSICNIKRDQTVERLEELLDDSIENIISIIKKATVFPDAMTVEEIEKYEYQYKEKLGIYISEEQMRNDYDKIVGIRKKVTGGKNDFMPFEQYKKTLGISSNCELTWTMDHKFVYDTLSTIYNNVSSVTAYDEAISNDVFNTVWPIEKINEYPLVALSYKTFMTFLQNHHLYIESSFPTSQDYDWESMYTYISKIKDFIEKQI